MLPHWGRTRARGSGSCAPSSGRQARGNLPAPPPQLLDFTWTTAEPGGGALDLNYTLFESVPVEEHWRVVDASDDGDLVLMLICEC